MCVVVVAGYSGGFSHRPTAEALAHDGFPALALAHFNCEGLPRRMENIDLHYFRRAAGWLRGSPEVGDSRLVLMGTSRGAELALQVATLFSEFDGVVATSPSHVRWPAPGGRAAAWTVGGEPLPCVRPRDARPPDPEVRVVDGKAYGRSRSYFPFQLRDNPSVDAARIPVERVHGPLLLFAGRDDDLWPSDAFADELEARARRLGLPHRVENIQYDGVGHDIPLPGEAPLLRTWDASRGTGMSFGGEAPAAASAATDRWDRIRAFLSSGASSGGG